ncbi:MAG: TorF family putative porin [Pseudomonadota bacterium]
MLKKKLLVVALASSFALPALADDLTVSSNVSLVSDYLYRGISQSGALPALQGGFDLSHASGLYAGVWGSSISWLSDAGVANSAGLELDTYAGYKGAAAGLAYDVGFLRYNYPGSYAAGATTGDTNEIYGALSYSIVTAKLSYALGDTFGAPDAAGTTYAELNASYAIPDTGISVAGHFGSQTYKGSSAKYTAFIAAGTPSYTDNKLSVTKDFSGYVAGIAFSSTNASAYYTSVTAQAKKLGKSTAVLSLSRAF